MSTSYTRIALASLAAAASLAFAAGAQAQLETVVITAPATEPLPVRSRSDRDELVGSYQMSDGRQLSVRSRAGFIVADLDGHPSTVLRPAGGSKLSSEDKRMQMRFHRDRDDLTLVTVSLATDGATQTIASLAAPRR